MVATKANTFSMQEFLRGISREIVRSDHAVLVLDAAEWHRRVQAESPVGRDCYDPRLGVWRESRREGGSLRGLNYSAPSVA